MFKVRNLTKSVLSILMCALMLVFNITVTASAQTSDYVKVVGYDENVDYSSEIAKCVADGSETALQMAAIYELQRNLKIDDLKMPYGKTYYFQSQDRTDADTVAITTGNGAIEATGYDPDFDYSAAISQCSAERTSFSLQLAAIYELQRNAKIIAIGEDVCLERWNTTTHHWFDGAKTWDDVEANIVKEKEDKENAEKIEEAEEQPAEQPEEPPVNSSAYSVTDYERDLLYRIVACEGGCDWFPDWVQQGICIVVLNRRDDSRFPNTIQGVLSQSGQYGPWQTGWINTISPTSKVKRNVDYVLETGKVGDNYWPKNVLGQNGTASGNGVYTSYYDSILGSTTYFTYM